MVAECVRAFLDTKTGNTRKVGERFEVTAERFSAINSTKYGQLVREVEEKAADKPTAAQETKARRPRARKTKTEE